MNEELKIVIRAITEQAQKELKKVKKELKDLAGAGSETEQIAESFENIAKKAAIATTAITALVAGMVKLGTESANIQKIYGRLESGFASVGLTAEQAHSTFRGLYRFLGDEDTALEAANLMAQLTNETKGLAEWQTILQGVYARFPDSLPIESLIEATNETAKVGKITGTLADALNWVGVSEDAVNAKLETLNSTTEREAYLRSLLLGLYEGSAIAYEQANAGIMNYYESQATMNEALAGASQYLVPLLTQMNNMAATLLQVLYPAIEAVCQVLIVFVQWIAAAASAISAFFGGSTSKVKETSNNMGSFASNVNKASSGMNKLGSGIDSANKKAKELKKLTMGFDELNVVNPASAASSASGAGAGTGGVNVPSYEIPDYSSFTSGWDLDSFYEELEEVREKIQAILVLVGIVGGAFAYWKIFDAITNPAINFSGVLKTIGGYALIVGGALLLVKGYTDAWVNGVDWKNFAITLGGIAAIIGGLYLTLGSLGAQVGLVAGGIALIVLGIKDFIENGYSMEAVIMIAVGAIAALIGVILILNAALLANPITWVVVAIIALVAAFVILWNECEGFRNFWINLWEKVKAGFSKAWEAIVKFFTETIPEAFKKTMEWLRVNIAEPIANFYNKWVKPVVDKLIEIVKKLVEVIGALFIGLWNLLNEKVITPIVNGFKGLWEKVKGFFKSLWEDIKTIFSPVVSWLSGVFSQAWEAIKNVFNGFANFFGGLWDKIKNTFSKLGTLIGDAISNAVKAGINAVISLIENRINKAVDLINGAIDLINKLPGVSVSKLTRLTLPRLAKGGVVDSATIAMFGEAGKEAVIPLENNTEWMDILADRINSRNQAPSKIVLMLDKKELGWANINSINDITKQTGTLQLSLV